MAIAYGLKPTKFGVSPPVSRIVDVHNAGLTWRRDHR